MKPVILTVFLGLACTFCLAQDYENKTALVIGNTNYEVGRLRNPVNDARALSETLDNLGFDVITKYDLDKTGLRSAVREFGNAIKDKDGIAFFYYSGHGLQSEGINYLVPVDADITEEYEIPEQCVGADHVLRMLNGYKNPFNIIILDACRNNPYESRYRSASRGLAQPEIVPTGSIMAYSTSPGRTASDGEGEYGLYTQELIKAINTPGLDIEDVFKTTRNNVMGLSGDKQIPWETSSLTGGDFYFTEGSLQATDQAMREMLIREKLGRRSRQYITSYGIPLDRGNPSSITPFTEKLIDALNTKGGLDQVLTASELRSQLNDHSYGEFGSHIGGELVFIPNDPLPKRRLSALVIGIDNQDYNPPLTNAVRSAGSVNQVLKSNYNCDCNYLENPTKNDIKDAIAKIGQKEPRYAPLFVFVAAPGGIPKTGLEGYVITKEEPDPNLGIIESRLTIEDLSEWINALPASNILIALDVDFASRSAWYWK